MKEEQFTEEEQAAIEEKEIACFTFLIGDMIGNTLDEVERVTDRLMAELMERENSWGTERMQKAWRNMTDKETDELKKIIQRNKSKLGKLESYIDFARREY